MKYDIFLSYSRKNVEMMNYLRDDLRGIGFSVWTDELLQPGTPVWELEIEKALKESSCLVVLLSPDAHNSEWVRREITLADELKTTVFPLWVEGADESESIPLRLITAQWIDVRQDYKKGFDILVSHIQKQIGLGFDGQNTQSINPSVEINPPPKSKLIFVSVALSLVLFFVAFGFLINLRLQEANTPASIPTQPRQQNESTLIPLPAFDPNRVSENVIAVQRNIDWEPVSTVIDGIEMVLVPPGCFNMGSSPQQIETAFQGCETLRGSGQCQRSWFEREDGMTEVCFTAPFWIDRYEVTNQQYELCVAAQRCLPPDDSTYFGNSEYLNYPVTNVDWVQANQYATWRNKRLPTEAEWEYAARGPDDLIYPWGNESPTCERSNILGCGGVLSSELNGVYVLGASWVGALHMSGNVWEWTSTIYRNYPYKADDSEDNSNLSSPRSVRGGSFIDDAGAARTAFRLSGITPNLRYYNRGFRLVRAFTSENISP